MTFAAFRRLVAELLELMTRMGLDRYERLVLRLEKERVWW